MQAVRITLNGLPACWRRRQRRGSWDCNVARSAPPCTGAAHAEAAAPDGSFAAQFSTVVVVGRQSDQRRDLTSVEAAQLGQFGDEHGTGGRRTSESPAVID